jgi:hypothetical protein
MEPSLTEIQTRRNVPENDPVVVAVKDKERNSQRLGEIFGESSLSYDSYKESAKRLQSSIDLDTGYLQQVGPNHPEYEKRQENNVTRKKQIERCNSLASQILKAEFEQLSNQIRSFNSDPHPHEKIEHLNQRLAHIFLAPEVKDKMESLLGTDTLD